MKQWQRLALFNSQICLSSAPQSAPPTPVFISGAHRSRAGDLKTGNLIALSTSNVYSLE